MKRVTDILVVDDEPTILEAISKTCMTEGLSVVAVDHPARAVDVLCAAPFRVILSDILMPHMDGFEFLRRLHARHIETPVIMTTGFSTVEYAVRSLSEGAIDFLPKPFTADELLSCVTRGIRYRAIQEEKTLRPDEVLYVVCPSRYLRLGYSIWAFLENDGSARIGVTDLFLKTIETVEEIRLASERDEVIQGNACACVVNSRGNEHQVMAPLSGRILEVNRECTGSLLQKDPYFQGWFYRIIPSDPAYEAQYLVSCSSDAMGQTIGNRNR